MQEHRAAGGALLSSEMLTGKATERWANYMKGKRNTREPRVAVPVCSLQMPTMPFSKLQNAGPQPETCRAMRAGAEQR